MTVPQIKGRKIVAQRADNPAERDSGAVLRDREEQRREERRAAVEKMRKKLSARVAVTR